MNMDKDPYQLQRFLDAQEPLYDRVVQELKNGAKRSHWMWFIFPQLRGLGWSEMAQLYAIRDLDEARAYLAHPILGGRLLECCRLLNELQGKTVSEILGHPDNLKLRSSLTLFHLAAPQEKLFLSLLEKFYACKMDEKTVDLLNRG